MVSATRRGLVGTTQAERAEKHEGKKKAGTPSGGGSDRRMSQAQLVAASERMEFKATRYPHECTMQELGILEDCQILFNEMVLKKFKDIPYPSHEEATFQFLATLEVKFLGHEDNNNYDGDGYIRFKHGSHSYHMNFMKLENIFRFKAGLMRGDELNIGKDELNALWDTIGVGKFKPGVMKSTKIRQSVLRYVHKVITHTFFGRKESSTDIYIY